MDCEVSQYHGDAHIGEMWLNTVDGREATLKRI